MSEEKKVPEEQHEETKKGKFSFSLLFYRNGFVLVFSVVTAVVLWFAMLFNQATEEEPRKIFDVPITINMSTEAQNEGLKIYSQTHVSADLSISGSTAITNRLTYKDFEVTGTFSPSSTKVTGTGLKTEVITLRVSKKNNQYSDYKIETVDPEEIIVEYDRVKEVTLEINNEVVVTPESGYYVSEPVFSETDIIISGPESSVNKISRVAAVYELDSPVKEEMAFTCGIVLYDTNNKAITDYSGMYLELSTETVDVTVPVAAKKTVQVKPTTINMPDGFAESRIIVSPETIDITASPDEINKIDVITLETPIDFSDVSLAKNEFKREITLASGLKNLSEVDTAEITVDLTGYKEAVLTTSNITVIYEPAGKDVLVSQKTMTVTIIGSESQINKLTGESVYCTVDMSNWNGNNGSMEVGVKVSVSGANSCWAYGKYNASITVSDAAVPSQTVPSG